MKGSGFRVQGLGSRFWDAGINWSLDLPEAQNNSL